MPLPARVPQSLKEFHLLFPDEAACIEYLFHVRWPDGFLCPDCGDVATGIIKTRGLVRCKKGHQTSVTASTAMHRTKQPLWDWLLAAFLLSTSTNGFSALQLRKQLGVKRYETTFQLLHKLRSAMYVPDREKLKGVVEVDESFIGGPEKVAVGHEMQKAIVVSAIEVITWEEDGEDKEGNPIKVQRQRAGRIRMGVVANNSQAILVPWVKENVAKGAHLVTDGSASYTPLLQDGYTIEKHVANRYGKPIGDYLYLTGLIISNLKAWLLGTFHGAVKKHHLQAYLNEFVFRFNRRFWNGPAFIRCLQMLMQSKGVEYAQVYGVKKGEGGYKHPNPSAPRKLAKEAYDAASPERRAWIDSHPRQALAELRASLKTRNKGE